MTLFVILVVISSALGCQGERKSMEGRCDYDGVKIEPIYAVYFTLQDGTEKKFCSIVCASMSFSKRKGEVKQVMVVDEASEKRIDASQAFFVESEIVTVPHVKNRIHVFAKEEDALRHLKEFRGKRAQNPFLW
jgi:ribosomal protein L24E